MRLNWLHAAPLTLLSASLVFAFSGCSGAGSAQSEYEESKKVEQGFADRITAAGGAAKKEGRSLVWGKVEGSGWVIDLSGDTIPEELIDAIIEKRKQDMVIELNLSGSTITDDQLAKLDAGNVLEYVLALDLSNTQITDAGLDKCSRVYVLGELKAVGSKITKEGADRLGERKIKDPKTPSMFKRKPKVVL